MENMLAPTSKKLRFWDLYSAIGRETRSPQRSLVAQGRACAATTLQQLQEQAVKQQQPMRYP